MTTISFFRRYISHVLSALACAFCLIVCLYAKQIENAVVVQSEESLYFLVSDRENIEVGAYFAQQQGGAGTLLRYEDRTYAVLSVYSSRQEGENARTAVENTGELTRLISVPVGDMYFKTRSEKERTACVTGGLNTLYQNARVLEQIISALDNGMTQERCKDLLHVLEKEFSYMSEVYKNEYYELALVCRDTAQSLTKYQNRLVYAQDLRAELCTVCTGYLKLRSEFSL